MGNIKIKNLSFGFDTQATLLFDHTNLVIDTDWKLGLIGRNGRGKTTLLKLLQNDFSYQGTIEHTLDFVYFPQKVADKSLLTHFVLEELSEFEDWKLERELNLLKVDPEIVWRPFESLSGGEQTKVLLALLFVDDLHFPLIDEPTNHLDKVAREQVASYLQNKKQGFILVSHDRRFVDEVVDHVLSIEKSQLILYQGNFSVYEEQKKRRDSYEQEQNVKLKKEIGRLKQTSEEKAEWSRGRERDKYGNPNVKGSGAIGDTGAIGARAARVMKRSKAMVNRMDRQAKEKEKLLHDIEYIDPLTMDFRPTHHKQLLKIENLQLSYGEKKLFDPLSFEINQKERVVIQGANGSGKSSLIQFLLGQFTGKSSGSVLRPQKLTISYVRQNYEDNHGTLQEFSDKNHLSYQEFLNNLHKLGLERKVFQTRIEDMSMGQRKRVEIAKSLATPAELYIWDEPLNYLDVFNQEQLEEVIQLVEPTMLVVEHDAQFLENIGTKKIEL